MVENPCEDQAAIEALIQRALVELQDEEWDQNSAVPRLRRCANQLVFETAKRLCQSIATNERALGADILGQFGTIETGDNGVPYLKRVFEEECRHILLGMLETEQAPEVLNSLGVALGHMKHPDAIEPLIKLKNHKDAQVRFGVAFGLGGHEHEQAINALIELSQDTDTDTRDWATFGLGTLIDTDTPSIREALLRNVHDPDEDTRMEALMGLLQRQDQRIIPHLLNEIEAGIIGIGSEMADLFYELIKDLPEAKTDPRLAKFMQAHKGTSNGRESL